MIGWLEPLTLALTGTPKQFMESTSSNRHPLTYQTLLSCLELYNLLVSWNDLVPCNVQTWFDHRAQRHVCGPRRQ